MQIAASPNGVSGTEAAAAAQLAVPTAHHLLGTLCAEGLLARDAERRYVLGPAVAVLSDAYSRDQRVPGWLFAPLRQLADETGETTYLTTWRGDEIYVRGSIEGGRAVRVAGAPRGAYESPHARATGKLLLAYADPERRRAVLGDGPLAAMTARTTVDRGVLARELDAIRARGWSQDIEEYTEGVCCVAAPAMLAGVVVAAYTVSVPAHAFAIRRDDLLDAVRRAASAAVRAHPEEPEVP